MQRRVWRNIILLAALAVGVLVIGVLALVVGSADISFGRAVKLLIEGPGGTDYAILFKLRLPRVLLGIAVGGGLSVSGVILQGVFRNPLVEPYTLGISGGAALAVSVVMVTGVGHVLGLLTVPAAGFIGAVAVVALVYRLSLKNRMLRIRQLLLTGVMISFISSSLIMLMMSLSSTQDLPAVVFWLMGSLSELNRPLIWLSMGTGVLGLIVAVAYSIRLNALILGEDQARSLGVDAEKTKRRLFILASLVTGCCVAVAGPIGFVGLVVPHFVRMFTGQDHRFLLPASFLSGAIFLVACDMLARTMIPLQTLPVGVITGIVGGTLFVYTLTKRGMSW